MVAYKCIFLTPLQTWKEGGFSICLVGIYGSAMKQYPCWHKKKDLFHHEKNVNMNQHPHILNYGSAIRIFMIMFTFIDSPLYKIFSKFWMLFLLGYAKKSHGFFCVGYQENINCYCFLFILGSLVWMRPQTYQTIPVVMLVGASWQTTGSCGVATPHPPTYAKQYQCRIYHGFEIF